MTRRLLLSPVASLLSVLAGAALLIATLGEAAAQTYRIRPGDTLRIEVLEDPSLNRTVLVAPDGRISVSSAGTFRASGLSVDAVQRALVNRLAGNFAAPPNVFVALEGLAERRAVAPRAPATIAIYVLGETGKPGKLELEPGTTVLQAFAVMGGFTKFAATKRIQLRRTDPKSRADRIINLNYDAIESGAAAGRTTLMDGDVIVVPQRRLFE